MTGRPTVYIDVNQGVKSTDQPDWSPCTLILLIPAHPLCGALHGDADRHGASTVHLEAEGVHRALQRCPQPATLPRGPKAVGAGAHQRATPPLAGSQRAGGWERANRSQ